MTKDRFPEVLRSAVAEVRDAQRALRALLQRLDRVAAQRGGHTRETLASEDWLLEQHFRLERLVRRASADGRPAAASTLRMAVKELGPLLKGDETIAVPGDLPLAARER